MKTSLIEPLHSPEFQLGWNTAHEDVDTKKVVLLPSMIKGSSDYVEGYLACQDNLLKRRANARLQNNL